MANLQVKDPKRYIFCWRCGWKWYEWMGWSKFRQDKGRCFYCRIDALDRQYGPSLIATLVANNRKGKYKGQYYINNRPIRWSNR